MTRKLTGQTLPYRIWIFVHDNPDSQMLQIAKAMDLPTTSITGPVSALCGRGKLKRTGRRGSYLYSVVEGCIPPAPEGRYVEKQNDKIGTMKFVTSHVGNEIFDECRQNWPGYKLNKLLREVRT
ncbi:hypothetical protein [Dryocola sp. BD626]|uniref:hypothetical protein n=1 Tax=Dryocola sp. BD626 TaxID=3133273 RepID=UPI003F501B41